MSENVRPPQITAESLNEEVRFNQDFLQIQAEFALAVSRVTNISFEDALTEYTNMFNCIGGHDDITNIEKAWDEFISESKTAVESGDMAQVAHIAFEKHNREALPESHVIKNFGCFSYTTRELEGRPIQILVHFQNRDNKVSGPLSSGKIAVRKQELSEMFQEIRDQYRGRDCIVTGQSWLYNVPQYKALFPKEYQNSLEKPENIAQTKEYLQNLAVWGQFLKADGSVNTGLWQEFRNNLRRATTETELLNAFKVKVLTPHAPLSAFGPEADTNVVQA